MNEQKSFFTACLETYQQRSFLKAYNDTFELLQADTPERKEKVFRLRYDVFCDENRFEKPPYADQKLEQDAFDDRSAHFLLMHRASGEAAGTLRVILPNDDFPAHSFPAQKFCDHPLMQYDSRALSLCEVSRFCTSKRFRKRDQDGKILSAYYEQDTVKGQSNGKTAYFKRLIPYAPAALLQGAFEAALTARIMDAVWLVDSCHLTSLDRIGFPYNVLGPHIPYHGGAQPLIFNIKNVLDTMRVRNPHCWDIVTDSGRLQKMADTLHQNDWQDNLMDEESWDLYYEQHGEFRNGHGAARP